MKKCIYMMLKVNLLLFGVITINNNHLFFSCEEF